MIIGTQLSCKFLFEIVGKGLRLHQNSFPTCDFVFTFRSYFSQLSFNVATFFCDHYNFASFLGYLLREVAEFSR